MMTKSAFSLDCNEEGMRTTQFAGNNHFDREGSNHDDADSTSDLRKKETGLLLLSTSENNKITRGGERRREVIRTTTATTTATAKKSKRRKQRGPNVKSFPKQLWDVMTECSDRDDAFEWLPPDEKSFVVVDPDVFCHGVLDKTFKAPSRYASFIRKLQRWGFIRLTSGLGTDCFHHPLFQKSRGDLVKHITSFTTKVDD